MHALIEAHVLAAERLHGDDTTVPILARGKTDTGRIFAAGSALYYACAIGGRNIPSVI
ncbi:hypothetical protein [Mesorhizobium sp. M1423]|uniref:hypothetical protein n=1 Tax=Mesorhizobium sp. M1423 TaxID=2957101 RepID=UPI003339FDCB